MPTFMIEIRDLNFAYNGETVLENVHLEIMPGDFTAMIGPNGGGKTTLLKLMLGLLTPDTGSVRISGKPAREASTCIGYVPQDVHINHRFPITALDVVLMGMREPQRRWATKSARNRREAVRSLEQLGLADHAQRKIGSLSGGQLQRVFIARALVTRPKLLLLDEPTASIDPQGQMDFFRLLRKLNRQITILMVSHDLMAISRHVKSVACVNKQLHYHGQAEITGDMLQTMYPCTEDEVCPVELVAHGLPHRVLKNH
jgi:zinc transport system ATP-binding protein